MTDNEIIKALPTVAYGGHSCNKCKYKHEKGECRCGLKGCRITRNALDLINRQKAEIEELRKGFTADADYFASEYDSKIKAEAIKEFADELFTKFAGHSDYHGDTIHCIIQCMAEGKTVDVAEPLDTSKIKTEAIKECIEKVKEEIAEALESNYKARAERIDKHNVGDKTDFISYCGGKIDCLRGLEDFLDNLVAEMVGDE